jgi:hypothetical protein
VNGVQNPHAFPLDIRGDGNAIACRWEELVTFHDRSAWQHEDFHGREPGTVEICKRRASSDVKRRRRIGL